MSKIILKKFLPLTFIMLSTIMGLSAIQNPSNHYVVFSYYELEGDSGKLTASQALGKVALQARPSMAK